MDEGWTRAFAMLLGVLGNPDKAITQKKAELEPGCYKVIWEGGVRFRKSNVYRDYAEFYPHDEAHKDKKPLPLAETGQVYRIRHFVPGFSDMVDEQGNKILLNEVMYGYLEWARLFIPMSFPDGTPTME